MEVRGMVERSGGKWCCDGCEEKQELKGYMKLKRRKHGKIN